VIEKREDRSLHKVGLIKEKKVWMRSTRAWSTTRDRAVSGPPQPG
jgi:hypothetical protein